LLQQKVEAERIITANQQELHKHKLIYEQVVARCNATAKDYQELEKKIKFLEGERTNRTIPTHYDKENIQLIQLENSALRQEIATLKEHISSN
jgi:hypothetical protein